MKVLFTFFLIFLLIAGSPGLVLSQVTTTIPGKFQPSQKAWQNADKILKKMSVEEKVGQIIHIGINARFANQDSDYFQDLKRQVVQNKIGGILLFGAPIYESVHLVNRMQQNAKVPLLISVDAETGIGMRFGDAINFPWVMAVAATGDPEFARRTGEVTGREARAMGILQVLAPVLDVNNNPDNPVINVRSYGEDPQEVARFGSAFIAGVQSQRVIATAKHFPGHGDTDTDSHRGLPRIDVSRKRLDSLELVPFKKAVDAGVVSVMVAHLGLPQIDSREMVPLKDAIRPAYADSEVIVKNTVVPASLSSKITTDILRKDLKFSGLIVTDAMDMSGLTLYVHQDEGAVRAVEAGADVLLKPADASAAIRGLVEAVKTGRISEERINESARRLLAWKYEIGLFKQKITPLDKIDQIVANKEVERLTEEIAGRAITLVRNDAGLIPMKRDLKVFILGLSNGLDGDAIAGSLAQTLRKNNIRFNTVVLQDNSTPEQIARARDLSDGADIVIAAMYGRVRTGSTNSGMLPKGGSDILNDLLALDKKVIGISFGNPYILRSFPMLKTYIVAYGDMPALQRAAGGAVLGLQDVTGRLPISLPGLHPRGTGIQLMKK